jgi:hypothetical protein
MCAAVVTNYSVILLSIAYRCQGWTQEGMLWSAAASDRLPPPSTPPPVCSALHGSSTRAQTHTTADSIQHRKVRLM